MAVFFDCNYYKKFIFCNAYNDAFYMLLLSISDQCFAVVFGEFTRMFFAVIITSTIFFGVA